MLLDEPSIISSVEKRFAPPAFLVLRQVRDRTGAASKRTADAIIASVWPSRGLWLAGVEAKSNRSDWLRELKSPSKAERISNECSFFYVASPPNVIQVDEVPLPWGILEVRDPSKPAKVVRPATRRLDVADPSLGFVCSILRSSAERLETEFDRGLVMARSDLENQLRETNLEELRRDAKRVSFLEEENAKLRATVLELRRENSDLSVKNGKFSRVSRLLRESRRGLTEAPDPFEFVEALLANRTDLAMLAEQAGKLAAFIELIEEATIACVHPNGNGSSSSVSSSCASDGALSGASTPQSSTSGSD